MSAGEERCNLCFGRGYKPEPRKRGFYARTCKRCDGKGSVPNGQRNPEAHVKESSK